MKKLLFILFFFIGNTAFSAEIICQYQLNTQDKVELTLKSWKDTPHIKELLLSINGTTYQFSGTDFNLATMKWDNPQKWLLGALVQTDKFKLNFIHVGPGEELGQYSILDFGTVISGIPTGRYEPVGSCHLK